MRTLLTVHVIYETLIALAALRLGWDGGRLVTVALSVPRVAFALAVAAAAALATAAVLRPYGLDIFGGVSLAFVDLALVAPLVGLYVLAALALAPAAARDPLPLVAVSLALVGMSAAGLVAHSMEPFALKLETPTVVTGQLGRSITVGVLTDFQTAGPGAYEAMAIDRLVAARPDLILVPGDLYQAGDGEFERDLPALRGLLARLKAPLGTYAVIGNTDRPIKRFARCLEGTGIVWLHNQRREIDTGAGIIDLTGLGWGPSPNLATALGAAAQAEGPGHLTLAFTHEPGQIYALDQNHPPDLVVAGHTHGGQVRLPVIGSLVTLSALPARYASGLHRLLGTWLYVSRGVGLERAQAPRLRYLCPPEITLLTVVPRAP